MFYLIGLPLLIRSRQGLNIPCPLNIILILNNADADNCAFHCRILRLPDPLLFLRDILIRVRQLNLRNDIPGHCLRLLYRFAASAKLGTEQNTQNCHP